MPTPPPGFTLDQSQAITPPSGFTLDQAPGPLEAPRPRPSLDQQEISAQLGSARDFFIKSVGREPRDVNELNQFAAAMGGAPTTDLRKPSTAVSRVAEAGIKGLVTGFSGIQMPTSPARTGLEQAAQTVAGIGGNIAGYSAGMGRILAPVVRPLAAAVGPSLGRLASHFGPVLAPKILPYFAMAVQASSEGAAFSLVDAAINERDVLAKMEPADATLYLLKKAGITSAEWGAMVPAVHGLIQGLLRWLPAHDARVHPEVYAGLKTPEPVATSVIPPSRVSAPLYAAGADDFDTQSVVQSMFGGPPPAAPGTPPTAMAENFMRLTEEARAQILANPRAWGTRATRTNPRAIALEVKRMQDAGIPPAEIAKRLEEMRASVAAPAEVPSVGITPEQRAAAMERPLSEGIFPAKPSVGGMLKEERGAVGPRRTGPDYGPGVGLDARWVMDTNGRVFVEPGTTYHRDIVRTKLGGDEDLVQATGSIYNGRVVVDRSAEKTITEGDNLRNAVARKWMEVRGTILGERGAVGGVPGTQINSTKELNALGVFGASHMMNGWTNRADWDAAMLNTAKDLPGYEPVVRANLDKVWATSRRIFEKTMTDTAGQLASVVRLSELLAKGEAGAEWYDVLREQLGTIVPPGMERRFMYWLAITSQGTGIKSNVPLAVKGFIQELLHLPPEGLGFAGSSGNAGRLRSGQLPTGIKINDFANAPYDSNTVVVDRRMMRLFGFGKDVPTPLQGAIIKQRVGEFAKLKGITNTKAQSMLWDGFGHDEQFLKAFASKGMVPTSESFIENLDHNPQLKNRIQIALASRQPAPADIATPEGLQKALTSERWAIIGSEPGAGKKAEMLDGENYAMSLQRKIADRMVLPANVIELRGRWRNPKTGQVVKGETSYLVRGLDPTTARAIAKEQGQVAFMLPEGMIDTDTGLVRPPTGKFLTGTAATKYPEGHSILNTSQGPLPFAIDYAKEPTGFMFPSTQGTQMKLNKLLTSERGAAGKVTLSYDPTTGKFVPKDGGAVPSELTGVAQRLEDQFSRANFQNILVKGTPISAASAEIGYGPPARGGAQTGLIPGVPGEPGGGPQIRAPWWDMVKEAAASSLLYGPHTFILKSAMETTMAALQPFVKLGAAGYDQIAYGLQRAFGKPATRQAFAGEAAYDIIGKAMYLPQAAGKFVDALLHESRPGAIPGVAGQIVRLPFRWLDAGMQFFQELQRGGTLYSKAFNIAMNEKSADVPARIADLVHGPTTDMIAAAERHAKEYTFQDPLGKDAQLLLRLSQTSSMKPLAWFFKVPVNAFKAGIRYSPLGGLTVRGQGADAAEHIGRALVGSAIGAAAYMLAERGYITGEGPDNPSMRANLATQGWKPNAVKVGDQYIDIANWKPISLIMTMAANLSETYHSEEDGSAMAMRMVRIIANDVETLPFLSSLSDMFKAIESGQNAAEKVTNAAAGIVTAPLVPAFVRDYANMTDPYQRVANTALEQIQAKVPGWREGLMPKQDILGRPVPNEFLGGMPFLTRASTARDEPILRELYRLGIPLPRAGKTVIRQGQKVERSPQQLWDIRSERGEKYVDLLLNIIDSPGYAALDDEAQTALLTRFVKKITSTPTETEQEMRGEQP